MAQGLDFITDDNFELIKMEKGIKMFLRFELIGIVVKQVLVYILVFKVGSLEVYIMIFKVLTNVIRRILCISSIMKEGW